MRLLPCLALVFALLASGCSDETTDDPTDVVLGETTLVIVVNPRVNTLNSASLAAPGTRRDGVTVSIEDGPSATSDVDGIAVLTRVEPGTRTLRFSGSSGTLSVNVVDKDLRELAVSVTDTAASVMADVRYPFGGEVVEVMPTMSIAQVNQALNGSNRIVLFRGGTYTGNIEFNGSNVFLFGEGASGGRVTLTGDVTLNGSNSRIRGTRVTGRLSVNGSGNGVTFSQVVGTFQSDGSDGVFLSNRLCGDVIISGGNLRVLENAGAAPLARPTTGC
jgi:hypothetical protein